MDNLQREEANQNSKLEAAAMADISTTAETTTATLASEAGTATGGIATGANEDMAQL
jgi:hypothetical protein